MGKQVDLAKLILRLHEAGIETKGMPTSTAGGVFYETVEPAKGLVERFPEDYELVRVDAQVSGWLVRNKLSD